MRLIWGVAAVLVGLLLLLSWRPWKKAFPHRSGSAAGPVREMASGEPAAMRERARRLLAERSVRPENLDDAIRLLKGCADRLRPSDPRQDPKPYVEAREALVEAEKVREKALKDLWLAYARKRHLGDDAGARSDLRLILRTAGDPAEPDHRRALAALERSLPRPEPSE